MDLLREEILKKRRSLAEECGGKKFFKRSEMEKKKIQKLREEERREEELKAQRRESSAIADSKSSASVADSKSSSSVADSKSSASAIIADDSQSLADEKKNTETLLLPRQEVIRRLRILKQPMTLYGEDDQARLDRLNHVLKEGLFEVDGDFSSDGQTNDFLRDISEMKKRDKSGGRKRKSRDERGETRDDDDCDVDDVKDLKRFEANFEDLCDEDKILVFCKKLLVEWKQELDAMDNTERTSGQGKRIVATFQQCARYLTPLFNLCRNKGLQAEIREALMLMVNQCIKRDYVAVSNQYIKLAIGNAPWPIGVTMVGIHERSAREKIHTNSVAHIMNNDTTCKYLQSFKRLMTLCERRYPPMPSKAVLGSSVALTNGIGLQSLLAQESFFCGDRGRVSEERLRLMSSQNES